MTNITQITPLYACYNKTKKHTVFQQSLNSWTY